MLRAAMLRFDATLMLPRYMMRHASDAADTFLPLHHDVAHARMRRDDVPMICRASCAMRRYAAAAAGRLFRLPRRRCFSPLLMTRYCDMLMPRRYMLRYAATLLLFLHCLRRRYYAYFHTLDAAAATLLRHCHTRGSHYAITPARLPPPPPPARPLACCMITPYRDHRLR